jgi:hypothetical protein
MYILKKNAAFLIVEKHINHWDAWGLLAGGAPPDEYDLEIKKIVDALSNIKDQSELATIVKNVFDKAFGEEHKYEECLNVADLIWDDLQKIRTTYHINSS